jgi:hypothetical protein
MILPVPPMMTSSTPAKCGIPAGSRLTPCELPSGHKGAHIGSAEAPSGLRIDVKTKVYIVSGFTGEYEDKHDWEVSAFLSEDRAKSQAQKLNDWLLANRFHFDTPGERADDLDVVCPLDARFHSNSYTGTRYFVWSIDIEDSP